MKPIALFLAVFALLLAGCGGSGSSSSESTESSSASSTGGAKVVTISEYMFKPGTITVPVGTTIKFTNEDGTPHTATSKESGAFETGSIKTGKSGEITLEKTGTFAYYCAFHPFMKGTITVE